MNASERQEQREWEQVKTKGRRMTENNLEPEDTVPSFGGPHTGHKISLEQLAGLCESLLVKTGDALTPSL